MSPSTHPRRQGLEQPRKTFYHPDDGVWERGASLESAAGTIHAPASVAPSTKRGVYISVRAKFSIALAAAIAWAGTSIFLAADWLTELSSRVGLVLACVAIFGVAIAPGFMNAFLLAGLALDRRPKRVQLKHYPPLS